jgi:ribosome production factor 2
LGRHFLDWQATLKGPNLSKILQKKNDLLPFEDVSSLEFLCQKNDCSLFGVATHNKKRPHGIVLGRTFDGVILDMIELGVNVNTLKSFSDFKRELCKTPPCACDEL